MAFSVQNYLVYFSKAEHDVLSESLWDVPPPTKSTKTPDLNVACKKLKCVALPLELEQPIRSHMGAKVCTNLT